MLENHNLHSMKDNVRPDNRMLRNEALHYLQKGFTKEDVILMFSDYLNLGRHVIREALQGLETRQD